MLTISRRTDNYELFIDPGIEKAPVSILFTGANKRVIRSELLPREAERVVQNILSESRPGHLRLDSGSLGSVEFTVRVVDRIEKTFSTNRIASWLACTSVVQGGDTSLNTAPVIIRHIADDPRLLAASLRSPGPAVVTQLRAMAKQRTQGQRSRRP
jgi:hypothetical protein